MLAVLITTLAKRGGKTGVGIIAECRKILGKTGTTEEQKVIIIHLHDLAIKLEILSAYAAIVFFNFYYFHCCVHKIIKMKILKRHSFF